MHTVVNSVQTFPHLIHPDSTSKNYYPYFADEEIEVQKVILSTLICYCIISSICSIAKKQRPDLKLGILPPPGVNELTKRRYVNRLAPGFLALRNLSFLSCHFVRKLSLSYSKLDSFMLPFLPHCNALGPI